MPAKGKNNVKLLQFHRPAFDVNRAAIPQLTPESRRYVRDLVSRFPLLTVLDVQFAGWGCAHFRDPIHLNRDGAVRLTLAVAEAIARSRSARDVGGRWITLDGGRAAAPRIYQDLVEDLDQSRLAVSQGQNTRITMEGLR